MKGLEETSCSGFCPPILSSSSSRRGGIASHVILRQPKSSWHFLRSISSIGSNNSDYVYNEKNTTMTNGCTSSSGLSVVKMTWASFLQRWYLSAVSVASFYFVASRYKWGQCRSRTIGISCLMYLLPIPFLFHGRRVEAFLWLLVTFFSLSSDYFFVGQRHNTLVRGVHMGDRWLATCVVCLQLFCNIPFWFSKDIPLGATGCIFLIVALFCKVVAGKSGLFRRHVWWHSAWHFVGAVGRVFLAIMEEQLISDWT